MTGAWRRESDWVRLVDWEKKFDVFARVSTRSAGNMKDPAVFRRRLDAVGLDPARWAGGQQVHGRRVVSVVRPRIKEIARTDGLVTPTARLALRVFTADCVPVFLFDPVQRVLGLVHAGWRGVQKKIVVEAIEKMARCYHSQSRHVRVALGPHIGACCFDVGPEVAALFSDIPGVVVPRRRGRTDRRGLDLAAAIGSQVLGTGVQRDHLTGSPGCTMCDQNYFSYRRDQTDHRQVAVLCLRKDSREIGPGSHENR